MAYLLHYIPTILQLKALYIDFYIVLLTVRLFMCIYVLLLLSHCFALSWPSRSCKWELFLNMPIWLQFFQLLTHKIFSCHTIFETSHLKCITTHQISKTISYFSAFDSVVNCIKYFFQNTTHNSLPKTQKSNRKGLAFLFKTQPIKMLHLFTTHTPHMCKHVQTLIA